MGIASFLTLLLNFMYSLVLPMSSRLSKVTGNNYLDLHYPTPFIVSPAEFANFTSVLTRQTQIHLRTSFVCSQINLSFEKFLDIFLQDITVTKIGGKFTFFPPQTTSRPASLADFFLFFPQCGGWYPNRKKENFII